MQLAKRRRIEHELFGRKIFDGAEQNIAAGQFDAVFAGGRRLFFALGKVDGADGIGAELEWTANRGAVPADDVRLIGVGQFAGAKIAVDEVNNRLLGRLRLACEAADHGANGVFVGQMPKLAGVVGWTALDNVAIVVDGEDQITRFAFEFAIFAGAVPGPELAVEC